MKILQVHNFYKNPGGEDTVVRVEKELLGTGGHQVVEYFRRSGAIADSGVWAKATLPLRAVWAWDSRHDLHTLLLKENPHVAHFHNTFPLISPAAYYACRERRVATVQTLHNYRLLCPAATFFRSGRPCEDCLGKLVPWPGVVHACYRSSRAASAVTALMLAFHRLISTWSRQVNVFIALTNFAKRKFVEGGLPEEKIVVKPNFVHPDPGAQNGEGDYALYVGRLSPEKGVGTLVAAWQRLGKSIPLRIVGYGPLRAELEERAARLSLSQVSFEGWQPRQVTLDAMRRAAFLTFPSECYEGFPLGIAEAYACGVPVIASRLGAMEELVADGRTGLHFNPGDPEDLAAKVEWAWTHPEQMRTMGREARAEYETKYTAERNYRLLMEIYERAIAWRYRWK